jgi:hypothetical protein
MKSFSLLRDQASIHNKRSPRNIIACLRREEDDRTSEIFRKAPSTHRCPSEDIIRVFRVIRIHLRHSCLDISARSSARYLHTSHVNRNCLPRTNAVHINPLAGPLVAHCFGHLQHSSLRASICRDIDVRNERNDRSNIDDLPRSLEIKQLLANFLRGYK